MKIQTTGEQMQIKTGGVSMLIFGVVFVPVGAFLTALPFLGIESDNGAPIPKWASLIGLVFVAIGVFAVISAKKRIITLMKNGESSVTDTKIIGGSVKAQNFQTSDIIAVNLATRSEYVGSSGANNMNSGSTMQRRSDLHLILKDNSIVEVASSSGKGGFSLNGINLTGLIGKAPLSKEAEQIAAFLGVQVKYDDLSTLQGLKNTIMGAGQQPNTTPPINPDAPPPATPSQPAQTPPQPPAPVQPQAPPPSSQNEPEQPEDRQS